MKVLVKKNRFIQRTQTSVIMLIMAALVMNFYRPGIRGVDPLC